MTTTVNALTSTILNGKQLKEQMIHLIERGIVPYVKGQPGVGKSDIINSLAQEFNLEPIDIRLSGYEPSDLSGLPFRNGEKSSFLPTDLIPIEGDELPAGKDGWLVFLDEYNHAHPAMIRATYKLILDKMVGQKKVHENVILVMAGNRLSDNALSNAVGSAANSRVTHLYLGVDVKQWIQDFATPNSIDHRIVGFLSAYPDRINDFDPEDESQLEASFCCPRTWAALSNIIEGLHTKDEMDKIYPSVVGTISTGTAFEFLQFCDVYNSLVTVADVVKDPANTPIPSDSATRWATATMLSQNIDANNQSPIYDYMARFPIENRIIFLRTVAVKSPALTGTPTHRKHQIELGKYLNA